MASEIRHAIPYGALLKSKGYAKPRETKAKARDRRPGMSAAHLECVRALPCCACGRNPRSEAHHLLQTGERGAGLRSTDRQTVPLCTACHMDLHAGGSRNEHRFFERAGIDAMALAAALWAVTGNSPSMRRVLEAHEPRPYNRT